MCCSHTEQSCLLCACVRPRNLSACVHSPACFPECGWIKRAFFPNERWGVRLFAEPGLTCWPPRCLLLSPRHAAAGLSAWLFMQRSKNADTLERKAARWERIKASNVSTVLRRDDRITAEVPLGANKSFLVWCKSGFTLYSFLCIVIIGMSAQKNKDWG